MIKVCLDAGHGGSEAGAAANGYIEKDINLKVSLILRDELIRCGFDVIMTRTKDESVPLDVRGNKALLNDCNCLLSIHFNSMGIPNQAKGFEAIHSIYNDSAKWIALCISKEAVKLGLYERGVWTKESSSNPGRNYYGVLRSSEPIPGVILEGLFLDNENDVKFLQHPDFLKKLAQAYCKGLCVAYNIIYVSEQQTELTMDQVIEHYNQRYINQDGKKIPLIMDVAGWKNNIKSKNIASSSFESFARKVLTYFKQNNF